MSCKYNVAYIFCYQSLTVCFLQTCLPFKPVIFILTGGALDIYKPIPEPVLGRMTVYILQGLCYMWSLKILHRGQWTCVRVMDIYKPTPEPVRVIDIYKPTPEPVRVIDIYKPTPEPVLGRMTVNILQGLCYMWSLKILHRGQWTCVIV